jgi:hypothetical protein
MNRQKSVYLLIGSAKVNEASTSAALGTYLLDRLAGHGLETEVQTVHRALRTPARTREMLDKVDRADIFLLSFPLYVDTLPYLATAALEEIAGHRRALANPDEPLFAALCNCGFPEAAHCTLALEVCAVFAQQARLRWAGGLAMGAGGAVHGQRPRPKGMTRLLAAALDGAADALAEGDRLPEAASAAVSQPLMPNSLYTLMGNLGWHMMARQNRAWARLWDRPLAAKPVAHTD